MVSSIMAQQNTFDISSNIDHAEVVNAINQALKEVHTRFDFKGTSAAIEIKDKEITLYGDAEFQLVQVEDILTCKLAKRNVDVRFLDKGKVEKIGSDKVKQSVTVRTGVDQELGKKVVKLIKDSKLKVQAGIQGDTVRVTSAKKDTLQDVIALVRKSISDFPLQFTNYRD